MGTNDNVNVKTDGITRLHDAISKNDLDKVKELIQLGADVNLSSTNERLAPLHVAVQNNNEDIAKLLLQAGADIDGKDNDGFTPFIWAAFLGHLDMIKFLFYGGANINKFTNDKTTALTWAKNKKHNDIINFIKVEQRKDERGLESLEIEMIDIQGGAFTMGNANTYNNAEREATLNNFSISKNLVSQAKWKEIMNTNPSFYKDDNFPVEQVTFKQVQDFIDKLNRKTGKKYRLPTETEWEYTAKYGENIILSSLNEWCSDWYEEIKRPSFFKKLFGNNAPHTNPTGPLDGTQKVGRSKDYRSGYDLNYKYKNLGFRLVCDLR